MEPEINTLRNNYKTNKFFLAVSSIVAEMLHVVPDDRGRQLIAVRSIELVVRNFAESHPVFVFSIFVRKFLDDSCMFISTFCLQNSTQFVSLYYYYVQSIESK